MTLFAIFHEQSEPLAAIVYAESYSRAVDIHYGRFMPGEATIEEFASAFHGFAVSAYEAATLNDGGIITDRTVYEKYRAA
jgi:hypothetical protein